MHPAAERFEQTRREFLMRAGSGGMGLAALTHLLCSDGLAAPAPASPSLDQINPLDPRPPHFTPRAKALHLHFPGRRPLAVRVVRAETEAARNGREEAPRIVRQGCAVRLPRPRQIDGDRPQAELPEAWRVWHGALRAAAAPGDVRRRDVHDPLDAHRSVQSSPRAVDPAQRSVGTGTTDDRLVDHLRAGERIAEPSRLCRARLRPWCQWRGYQLDQRFSSFDV